MHAISLFPFDTVGRVLVFLITLSVLILVHEWGHFFIARRCGIGVRTFALGFGPALWSMQSPRTGTVYQINAALVGGYCAMIGEDNQNTEEDAHVQGLSYASRSTWQRLSVVLAGPAVNLLAAFVIMWGTAMFIGAPSQTLTTRVGELRSGFPAEKAGLAAGDQILSVNGHNMRNGDELVATINALLNRDVDLFFLRGGRRHEIKVHTVVERHNGKLVGLIGFSPLPAFERLSPLPAFIASRDNFLAVFRSTFGGLAELVTDGGNAAKNLTGVVGMARAAVVIQGMGVAPYMSFVALLSLSLGIFNLLPLPALDGGRALFVIIEVLRGRPIDQEKEAMVHFTGLAVLLVLIALIMYRDIVNLISGRAAM